MAALNLDPRELEQFVLPGFVSHLSLAVPLGDQVFQVDFSMRAQAPGFVALAEPPRAATVAEAAEVVAKLAGLMMRERGAA